MDNKDIFIEDQMAPEKVRKEIPVGNCDSQQCKDSHKDELIEEEPIELLEVK